MTKTKNTIRIKTIKKAKELIVSISKKEKIRTTFLKKDEGQGGYNYGGSAVPDLIMLSPFRKCTEDDIRNGRNKFNRYAIGNECLNPAECMLAAFFHELSHCKLNKSNPFDKSSSRYPYELWTTMIGLEYAKDKYGIEISDESIKWLIDENGTYAR